MKTLLIILFFLISCTIILFFILGINSKSKNAPGLIDGFLSKCPNTPNCVCSENKDHSGHYISPINISQNPKHNINYFIILKDTVKSIGGTIQIENENYFSAIFSSAIFGFVDDLEVRINSDKKIIHIRSASRVGRSDMGVNKKRVELLKQTFKKKINKITQN